VTRRIDLVALEEVPEGTLRMAFTPDHEQVVVVHANGVIRAFQGICTHEYFELDKGFLTGGGSPLPGGAESGTLTCALHLSRFDLGTGEALDPPAELPLATYPVIVEDGRVLIEVPEGPLPVNE
jgi:3-phenylpropionate/trans-cinnamate dioxygenase ferredoxin subunit